MNLDQMDRYGRQTIAEGIQNWVLSMKWEFADLDTISGHARGRFGLRGEDVVEFVRRSIHAMLDAGGVVMDRTANMDYPLFLPTARFGTTRDDVTEAVIAEWRNRGGIEGTLGWGEYAFAMPDNHPYRARRETGLSIFRLSNGRCGRRGATLDIPGRSSSPPGCCRLVSATPWTQPVTLCPCGRGQQRRGVRCSVFVVPVAAAIVPAVVIVVPAIVVAAALHPASIVPTLVAAFTIAATFDPLPAVPLNLPARAVVGVLQAELERLRGALRPSRRGLPSEPGAENGESHDDLRDAAHDVVLSQVDVSRTNLDRSAKTGICIR